MIKIFLAFFLTAAFSSCSGVTAKLLITQGNFLYTRGDFERASALFINALDDSAAPLSPIAPYAAYSLGAAYLAMDAGEAALTRFNEAAAAGARPSQHRELTYRIHYNSGIVHFQQNNYQGAAEEFKRALQINPSRAEAKHNLELCHLSLQRQKNAANVQSGRMGGIRENPNEKRSGILLDFMRRKESELWRSFEWGGDDDSSTPDY